MKCLRAYVRFLEILCLKLLFLDLVEFKEIGADSKVCRHFKDDISKASLPIERTRETLSAKCPPSPAAFSVYNVNTAAEEEQITNLTFLICWSRDVKRIALHFETTVTIDDVNVRNVFKQCFHSNDTIYITRQSIVNTNIYHLVIHVPATSDHEYSFRAFYDHRRHVHVHGRHKIFQYLYIPKNLIRQRRSLGENVRVTHVEECGKTRGCYRHGTTDCEHFSCDYFFSYNTTRSVADIEISAKTDGWVAIGFSSDRSMGGDDLVVCSRKTPLSTEVLARTYKNPYSHDHPVKRDNIVTLKESIVKDGYVYCHVTCPVSATDRQDLSNAWYQLYAKGSITQSGELEKHDQTPFVSKKAVTMFVLNDEQTNGSLKVYNALSFFIIGLIYTAF